MPTNVDQPSRATGAGQPAASAPRWASWHLHLPQLGTRATDQAVRDVVGPAVDCLHRQEAPIRWFFVRYWQFGPHVRVRAAGLAPEQDGEVDRQLRARLASLVAGAGEGLSPEDYRRSASPLAQAGEGGQGLDVGELRPPGVYREPYRPEVERYGGAELMALSESLFQQSSQLALAFLRLDPPDAARRGLGLRATWAALSACVDRDRLDFCRRAAEGWQAWGSRGGGEEAATEQAEVEAAAGGEMPRLPLPRLVEGRSSPPVGRWAERLSVAMTQWRAAGGGEQAERILRSHIHMLHNRLGLSVHQERHHYLALAATLTSARGAVAS